MAKIWVSTEQVTVGRTKQFITLFHPDIILVMIGFYVGDEKADVGSLPYNILIVIAAAVMILSEVLRDAVKNYLPDFFR